VLIYQVLDSNDRYPEREQRFAPKLVTRLLMTYPNLYFDLSNAEPGRKYKCGDHRVLDNVMWKEGSWGGQTDSLKTDYRKILVKFSNRFVAGFDYGPSNRQSASFLKRRIDNIRHCRNPGFSYGWGSLVDRQFYGSNDRHYGRDIS